MGYAPDVPKDYGGGSSWRPDGWVEISNDAVEQLKKRGMVYTPACFSAGADAMLEALFKLAEESPTKTFTIDSRGFNIYRGVK